MPIGPGLPGAVMEALGEGFACGLTGTIFITIDDSDGNNIVGPTTADIIELECSVDNYGVYRYLGTYPLDASLSPYVITWEGASASDPGVIVTATEDILVSDELIAVPSGDGPCTDWISEDDVLACCNSVEASSGLIFSSAIEVAQGLLYQLSGRKYAGLCGPITVRPCRDNCSCFPAQRLAYASGGSRLLWTGAYWGTGNGSRNCGCGCLSQVKLSGFPVQIITEVKIDGDVVAPSEYRLDEGRYLTRLNGSYWPSCQDLSLSDDEDGTFSVTYAYGASPPASGVDAAAQLACEIYKQCAGGGAGECLLPTGATRVTRQGITIERQFFQRDPVTKAWRTGLPLVDLFLNADNPAGLQRRPVFWAPGRRYARPIG